MKTLTQSNTQYNYTQAQNRVGGYGVNGLNQYTQIDGEMLQHNANGNLTQDRAPDGQLITYTYDMENHLVAAAGPVASTLTYDTLGRLSRLTLPSGTTQFLYDGDALVAEYLNGTLTRRYVHGDQVDEPLVQYNGTNLATRRYLHADHQGSVIAHSDGAGAATQKNAYDPYGIPATTNSGRFGYTGQTWIPELGLNYYKARIYSPRLGRFLQTDPIFYADQMNLYAYVRNDPVNKIDPTGMDSCETVSPDGSAGAPVPNCIGDPNGPSTPTEEADRIVNEITVTATNAKSDKKIQNAINGHLGEAGFKTEDGVFTSVDLIPACKKGKTEAYKFPSGFLTQDMSSAGHTHNAGMESGLGPHDAAMALQVGMNIQIDSSGTRGIAKLSTGSAIAVSANGRWGDAGRRSTANTVLDLANATKGGSSNAPSTTSPCP